MVTKKLLVTVVELHDRMCLSIQHNNRGDKRITLCRENLVPIATQEVYDALIRLNTKKSSGPDGLDPYFKYCRTFDTHFQFGY